MGVHVLLFVVDSGQLNTGLSANIHACMRACMHVRTSIQATSRSLASRSRLPRMGKVTSPRIARSRTQDLKPCRQS